MATSLKQRPTSTALSFKFTGDLADEGQLNFYEASRFLYGASRFVYTLEHFRQTGVVMQRINRRVDADFNIRAPQPGSWVLDVLAGAAPIVGAAPAASALLEVPLKVLTAWVIKKLTGGNANQVEAILKLEQERTKQSRQETRRLELQAMTTNKLAGIIEQETKRKDALLSRMLDELRDAREEAKFHGRRDEQLKEYEPELEKVREKDLKKLLVRARSQVAEMGLPLKGSASRLVIGGKSDDDKIVFLTKKTIDLVEGNTEDPSGEDVVADVVRFDKESGWGKFRVGNEPGQISFFIPPDQRRELKGEVIEAMKHDYVSMTIRYVRDKQKSIKYARVEAVLLLE